MYYEIVTDGLKDCPLCGGRPKALKSSGGDERCGYNFHVKIVCVGCGLSLKRESHKDKNGWCDDSGQGTAAVVEAWNTRDVGKVVGS